MMDKTYDPKSIEQKWYENWESNNYFAPSENALNSPYCLMIPPPNVTGHLHMGHAFQNALMDTLIRYYRMKSHKTLWQVGTDHAGIATQMVVERNLLKDENLSRHDLGREKFIEKIWEWKNHSGNTITQQLRRLGSSVDWSRERFTMDEGLSHAVLTVFVKLYREGLIYKGKRLVNWDPILHTAVSDLEVSSEDENCKLWYLRYPLAKKALKTSDNLDYLVVATTRPETMLGDVAVAVNPLDDRYKHLIGEKIILPIVEKEIPIIADDYVDPEFGTGCVKITPAHDFNDYEIGKRHNLPMINIFDIGAKLNENTPQKYHGLDRFEARDIIVKKFESLNLLEKIEDYSTKIPRGDRTGAVIEPYLTDQWFVKVESLAKPAIEAVKNGEIKFVPENWSKTYFEWLNNIQDWCISRQLWWGHRIPAWYDEKNNIYVGFDETEVRDFYQLKENVKLTQDEDVLDTWFSSALWPFSTLGWPDSTEELDLFYPTNVLITGFDIIFFWVARMIMFGLKFTGKIPFKEVYIHGLIQDHLGQKMSKSKGNVLDPIDLIDGIDLEHLISKRTSGLMQPKMAKSIEKNTRKEFPNGIPSYGVDALRFTFCALATSGRHIRFDLARIEGYRNFCNKIWNASRYIFMNIENYKIFKPNTNIDFSLADKWIFSRWQQIKQNLENHIEKYRFDLAAYDIYEFIWNDFCDWYLELSKPILQHEFFKEELKNATRYTLISMLDEILRVIHPFMPFISEEIWQKVKPFLTFNETDDNECLISASYPDVNKHLINDKVEQDISLIKKLIVGIRNIRGEMNISPNKPLNAAIINCTKEQQKLLENNLNFIKTLAKLESISFEKDKSNLDLCAQALANNLEILIPMKGLINIEEETTRLKKEIEKVSKDIAKCENKLNNPNYVNKAPKDVVDNEKSKLQNLSDTLAKLLENLKKISNL